MSINEILEAVRDGKVCPFTKKPYAYDLERVRVALADATKAADALAAHSVPDWVAHRLATFKAEARGLDLALKEHQQENNQ